MSPLAYSATEHMQYAHTAWHTWLFIFIFVYFSFGSHIVSQGCWNKGALSACVNMFFPYVPPPPPITTGIGFHFINLRDILTW